MDRLCSPWRYAYVSSPGAGSSPDDDPGSSSCVFCSLRDSADPPENNFILHRARYNYVVLNLYPYISGHLLIIPYEHIADLDAAAKETTDELMDLTKHCQTALREAYRPDGINLGMNLGRAAGAGVAGHLHLHILPRWLGDANFMTTIGETRVIPEDLNATYAKLKIHFS